MQVKTVNEYFIENLHTIMQVQTVNEYFIDDFHTIIHLIATTSDLILIFSNMSHSDTKV